MAELIDIKQYKIQGRKYEAENRMRRKVFIALSVGLYIFSLVSPVCYTNDNSGETDFPGCAALVFGAVSLFGGGIPEFLVWLANPLLYCACYNFYHNRKQAGWQAMLAVIAAGSFLFFDTLLAAENGRRDAISHLGIGYYLWLASCILLMLGCHYNSLIRNKQRFQISG